VSTSQRRLSGNSLSFFTLQFWRKKKKKKEEERRKLEIIKPSASKSLKTKVFFPDLYKILLLKF